MGKQKKENLFAVSLNVMLSIVIYYLTLVSWCLSPCTWIENENDENASVWPSPRLSIINCKRKLEPWEILSQHNRELNISISPGIHETSMLLLYTYIYIDQNLVFSFYNYPSCPKISHHCHEKLYLKKSLDRNLIKFFLLKKILLF